MTAPMARVGSVSKTPATGLDESSDRRRLVDEGCAIVPRTTRPAPEGSGGRARRPGPSAYAPARQAS